MSALITGMSFSREPSRRRDSWAALAGTSLDLAIIVFFSASSLICFWFSRLSDNRGG